MIIELTNQQEDEIRVKIFKALSDPTRLEILRFLKKTGRGVTCGEVGEIMSMKKSVGSYHFKVLRDAGLTRTEKKSREKYVSINYEMFDKYLKDVIETL